MPRPATEGFKGREAVGVGRGVSSLSAAGTNDMTGEWVGSYIIPISKSVPLSVSMFFFFFQETNRRWAKAVEAFFSTAGVPQCVWRSCSKANMTAL